MKCKYCGHEIPDGVLYCDACGNEVRIVPDYNPLDDMLTEQVRFSIDEQNEGKEDPDYLAYDRTRVDVRSNTGGRTSGRSGATGRITGVSARTTRRTMNTRVTGDTSIRATGKTTVLRQTGRTGNTGRTGRTGQIADRTGGGKRSVSRKKKEQKMARLRRKRRIVILVLILCIAAIAGISYALYINSYTGIVRSGNNALKNQEYSKAESYFKRAIKKNKQRPEAYSGLAKTYLGQDEDDKAENVFLDAIDTQSENADLYDACFQFYLDTDQTLKIPELLDDADDSVQEQLSEYDIDRPTYSLDDKKTYDDVQQVTLTAGKGMTIYYTTDGTDPTFDSDKYKEPIQLEEGENDVRAIAVNKKGIPSSTAQKVYKVVFPIEEAPAISPSTGQYESSQTIEIKVPDGYTAYYTMNGKTPTTSSKKYTGPIKMPEGETLFKAILVNSDGRSSGVTTRNYVLDLSSSKGNSDTSSNISGNNSDSSDISTSDSNTDGLGTDTTTGSRSNRVITGKGGASE